MVEQMALQKNLLQRTILHVRKQALLFGVCAHLSMGSSFVLRVLATKHGFAWLCIEGCSIAVRYGGWAIFCLPREGCFFVPRGARAFFVAGFAVLYHSF